MPAFVTRWFDRHPRLTAFLQKVQKDNVGMLATVISWTLLTSLVPIIVGLLGISGFILRDPTLENAVVAHVASALQGALTRQDVRDLVTISIRHRGILAIVGVAGIVWGGSNVGGAISTVFQPIFQVGGRNFFVEKALDIVMIVVFTVLLIVVVAATSASTLLQGLFRATGVSAVVTIGTQVVGTLVALLAAFILFAVVYVVFPNVSPRFTADNIWPGAAIAAVLFEALTYAFPVYAHFSHFQRYGAVLFPILLLTAWIYFFSMILLIGAEFVSFQALNEGRALDESIGPPPDGTVPQRIDERVEVS